MDEGLKRVLLIAAAILSARKLAEYDDGARVPATISAISDAIRWAEEILEGTRQALADTLNHCETIVASPGKT